MTIIDKVKALFALNSIIKKEKEIFMESGHSWFSTRFYLTAVTALSTLWGGIHGFVPQPWATIIPIIGVGIYTIAETIRKIIIDVQAAKAAASTDVKAVA